LKFEAKIRRVFEQMGNDIKPFGATLKTVMTKKVFHRGGGV